MISSDIAPPRLAHLVRQFNQQCRLDSLSPSDVSIISFDCFDFIATHYLYGPCLIALFSTHVRLLLFPLFLPFFRLLPSKIRFILDAPPRCAFCVHYCFALLSSSFFSGLFYPALLIK